MVVQPGLCQTWSETPKIVFLTTRLTDVFVCLFCCFTSTVNSCGHVGMVIILTTLLLGKLPGGSFLVLSVHSFAINWRLLLLNQRRRKNGRRNIFVTKSLRKNVPDVGGRSRVRLHLNPSRYPPCYPARFIIEGKCISHT